MNSFFRAIQIREFNRQQEEERKVQREKEIGEWIVQREKEAEEGRVQREKEAEEKRRVWREMEKIEEKARKQREMEKIEEKARKQREMEEMEEGRRVWQREKEEMEARKVIEKAQARVQRFRDYIEEKYGRYDVWLAWAQSLYIIHLNWLVESRARDWQDTRTWQCDSEIDALEKIAELVKYKVYDRARGRGNMESDLLKE